MLGVVFRNIYKDNSYFSKQCWLFLIMLLSKSESS